MLDNPELVMHAYLAFIYGENVAQIFSPIGGKLYPKLPAIIKRLSDFDFKAFGFRNQPLLSEASQGRAPSAVFPVRYHRPIPKSQISEVFASRVCPQSARSCAYWHTLMEVADIGVSLHVRCVYATTRGPSHLISDRKVSKLEGNQVQKSQTLRPASKVTSGYETVPFFAK